jgi:aspartate/methionine/tyrosine aminotransferase
MQTVDLATRMARLGTETAFEVLARARALEATGRDIVHLEIGEPGFDTPENVVEAAVKALRAGHTHYVQSAGIPEARAAITDVFTATRGVPAEPDQVVITPGAKPIMFFAILALVEQGDEAVLPDPSFPIYRSMVEFAGGVAVPYALPIEDGYRLDPAQLEELITPRTKLVILNSPGNPTGSTLPRADLERIAEIVLRHPGCTVLSDEIYRGLSFLDEPPASITEIEGMMERTIVLDGLSKTYAMTGWRAGWGICPPAIKPAIERLVVNSVSCTAAFVQHALIEALLGDQSAALAMRDELRARRDRFVPRLQGVPGLHCLMPTGAFYAYAQVRDTGMDGDTMAARLLDEVGIACLGGSGFGDSGRDFVRFSFGGASEELADVPDRITAWLLKTSSSVGD